MVEVGDELLDYEDETLVIVTVLPICKHSHLEGLEREVKEDLVLPKDSIVITPVFRVYSLRSKVFVGNRIDRRNLKED